MQTPRKNFTDPSKNQMSCINYRPEIDGLRAVAVIPVVLFHMGFQFVSGGFIGVDVFFVISGYLITSIILKENDAGVFKFSNFWLRRIRRIIPALVVMLITTSIVGYFFIYRGDLHDLGKHGISAMLSIANIVMWKIPGGYWGASAEDSLFLHTWSLSVEEQFYIFYPVLIFFIFKVMRKWLFHTIFSIALISFILYIISFNIYPVATFYLLPMRAWELAAGCLAAIFTWSRGDLKISESMSFWMPFAGILCILISYVFFSGETRVPGFLIIPVIGSVLIIIYGNNNKIINKILSSKLFVSIGKISYSLYLWHWPIIVLSRNNLLVNDRFVFKFSILFMIFIISVSSYFFIEKQTRHREYIIKPIFFLCVISLFLSTFLYKFPFSISYETSEYGEVIWRGQLYNVNPVDTWPASIKARMEGIVVPQREESLARAYLAGGIIKKYKQSIPEVVVLGDSHALMWSGLIDDICAELGLTVSFYGADGTSPFIDLPLKVTKGNLFFTPEEKYEFDTKKMNFIKEWNPKIVILVARWDNIEDIKVVEPLIQFISEVGSKIIIIEQPPVLYFGDKNAVQYLKYLKLEPVSAQSRYIKARDMIKYEKGRSLIRSISYKYDFCSVVQVKDLYYKDHSGVLVFDGYSVLYIDDDHLSHAGAIRLKDRMFEKFEEIIESQAAVVGLKSKESQGVLVQKRMGGI